MYESIETKCKLASCSKALYIPHDVYFASQFSPEADYFCDWGCESSHRGIGWFTFLKAIDAALYLLLAGVALLLLSAIASMPVKGLLCMIILILLLK